MIDPLMRVVLNFRQTLIRLGLADKDEIFLRKMADFLARHNKKQGFLVSCGKEEDAKEKMN